jgi:hypothetical protein
VAGRGSNRPGRAGVAAQRHSARPRSLDRVSRGGRLYAAQAAVGAVGGLADGGGVRSVGRSGASESQTSYEFMCKVFCEVLAEGVRAGLGAEEPSPRAPGYWLPACYGNASGTPPAATSATPTNSTPPKSAPSSPQPQ